MESESDRYDAILVISAWRELDSRPDFRARVLAGRSFGDYPEDLTVTSHSELLDLIARWLRRRMPEE